MQNPQTQINRIRKLLIQIQTNALAMDCQMLLKRVVRDGWVEARISRDAQNSAAARRNDRYRATAIIAQRKWLNPSNTEFYEAVITHESAEQMKVKVGI